MRLDRPSVLNPKYTRLWSHYDLVYTFKNKMIDRIKIPVNLIFTDYMISLILKQLTV